MNTKETKRVLLHDGNRNGGNNFLLMGIASMSACIMMMIFPDISLTAVREGLALWSHTVLPSLLPFMICTDILIQSGIHTLIGRIWEKPFQFIYGTPGISALIFFSSIFSGYPTGARMISTLLSSHEISKHDARNIFTFSSTSGPLFVIGAVGTGMLCSPKHGYIILISHYLSALITGIILIPESALHRAFNKGVFNKSTFNKSVLNQKRKERDPSGRHVSITSNTANADFHFAQIMSSAILNAFKTLLIIGGYIIIFSLLTDFIINIIYLFNFHFSQHINLFLGILEMTVGCDKVSLSPELSINAKTIFCSFLISFGGLSVIGQTLSVVDENYIKPAGIFWCKTLHGLISSIITIIILNI